MNTMTIVIVQPIVIHIESSLLGNGFNSVVYYVHCVLDLNIDLGNSFNFVSSRSTYYSTSSTVM